MNSTTSAELDKLSRLVTYLRQSRSQEESAELQTDLRNALDLNGNNQLSPAHQQVLNDLIISAQQPRLIEQLFCGHLEPYHSANAALTRLTRALW